MEANLAPPAVAEAAQPTLERLQGTRAVAGELLKTVSGTLKANIKANGPAGSIEACGTIAPEIANSLADRTGWKGTPVGAWVRDVGVGTRIVWQYKALGHLNAALKSGAKPQALEWSEAVQEGGKPVLHYAKAIVLQPQCVACHGNVATIPASVVEQLKSCYPHDQATGYAPGQLRGAVVISRPL